MADFPLTKDLWRLSEYQINAGTEAVPKWLRIGGLTGGNATGSKVDANTTTPEDDGASSHLPAERSQTIQLEGLLGYTNRATGQRDPGQVACEAWAADSSIGPDGLRQIRRIFPDGLGKCVTFKASAVLSDGGTLNEAEKWSLSVTRSGPATTTYLGEAAAVPSSVVPTAGDEQVSVAYTASGAASVQVFVYEVDTDEEVAWAVDTPATSPLVITGLTNGTDYYVRARSVTTAGAISALSAASATFTPTA